MNRWLKISSLFVISGISFFSVSAQEKGSSSFDFDYSVDSTGWRHSTNVSRLFTLPVNQVGRAGLQFQQIKGNTLKYNQAETESDLSVFAESYYRLSPGLMLYGFASFASVQEKQVVGSAFYSPETMSFDITFMDIDNTGNRKQEKYDLQGALSYKLSKQWAIGTRIDYEAINAARTKDLRHTNKVLSMNASAGATFLASDQLVLGLNYQYKRYIESVVFSIYGTSDQQYMSLINFGAFSGKQELFDTNGYTAKGETNPFVEQWQSVGFQLNWEISPRLRMFSESMYSGVNGYYGKKASSSVQFTEHSGKSLSEQLTFFYKGTSVFHEMRLSYDYWSVDNHENLWRSETSASGNTQINYYGQNLVGQKKTQNVAFSYKLAWGSVSDVPAWTLEGGMGYASRDITSILYPYFRTQQLSFARFRLAASHQRMIGTCNLWLGLNVSYDGGSGSSYKDGVYVTPSTDIGAPKYHEAFMENEYNYLTANRITPGIGARLVFPIKSLHYFVQVNYNNEVMVKSDVSTRNNQNISLKVGVQF